MNTLFDSIRFIEPFGCVPPYYALTLPQYRETTVCEPSTVIPFYEKLISSGYEQFRVSFMIPTLLKLHAQCTPTCDYNQDDIEVYSARMLREVGSSNPTVSFRIEVSYTHLEVSETKFTIEKL